MVVLLELAVKARRGLTTEGQGGHKNHIFFGPNDHGYRPAEASLVPGILGHIPENTGGNSCSRSPPLS